MKSLLPKAEKTNEISKRNKDIKLKKTNEIY